MKNLIKNIFMLSVISMLTACIPQADDDSSTEDDANDGGGSQTSNSVSEKEFSVQLSRADIRRVSNGELIDVDISHIKSDTLILYK